VSKHKLRLKRNRRRQRALLNKAERQKQAQQSAKAVLVELDRLINRLVHGLGSLQKARKTVLIQTLASIKN
jgi:hypothetical protein